MCEWINTDKCECYVGHQDDGFHCQSGKFKAISDGAKLSFYDSKKPMFASSSDEESKEGGLHCVLVGNFKPIGYKQDCKRKVFASIREDCKRRKEDLDDPTYVPEVPKDGKKKSDTTSKKKSAGLGVERFVFIFFSIEIIYYLISIIFDESSNI